VGEAAEIVRLSFERLNADDLEGFLELAHPEIELHDVPEIPGSTVYRGHEGGERIAVVTQAIGRGRGSGVEVDWTFTTVWGIRDGLISYHHGYSDRDDALRAIGAG
jgi:ketosteroid isomerase-like protein